MDSVYRRGYGTETRRIFWVGDSTVQINSAATWPQTGMGQALPLFISVGTALHVHARNGRSTKSFLDEGLFEPVQKAMQKDDVLLIQFGHNDSKPDEERKTEPYGSYTANLEFFAAEALSRGARPVFITPLCRRKFSGGIVPEHTHGEYSAAMQALAKKLGLPCIDLSEQSRFLINEKGEQATESWFMNLPKGAFGHYPDGLCDNTHLQYAGAVVFAEMVAQGIYGLGGAYKGFISSEDLQK